MKPPPKASGPFKRLWMSTVPVLVEAGIVPDASWLAHYCHFHSSTVECRVEMQRDGYRKGHVCNGAVIFWQPVVRKFERYLTDGDEAVANALRRNRLKVLRQELTRDRLNLVAS